MTDIVYIKGEDIAGSVAKLVRLALIDSNELTINMPGFSADMTGKRTLDFPEVGVDWRTVTVTGHTGDYHPAVFTPNGIIAQLVFDQVQTGSVTISNYNRFSTYPVGRVEDLTFDLFTYFGDPQASTKVTRHIPIAIPVINPENIQISRYAAFGQSAEIDGYICVYGGADQGGIQQVKLEAAKLFRYMRAYRFRFAQLGLTQLELDLPTFTPYQGKLYEGSIPFSCVVTLEPPPKV